MSTDAPRTMFDKIWDCHRVLDPATVIINAAAIAPTAT
jgi:hypothetical protein